MTESKIIVAWWTEIINLVICIRVSGLIHPICSNDKRKWSGDRRDWNGGENGGETGGGSQRNGCVGWRRHSTDRTTDEGTRWAKVTGQGCWHNGLSSTRARAPHLSYTASAYKVRPSDDDHLSFLQNVGPYIPILSIPYDGKIGQSEDTGGGAANVLSLNFVFQGSWSVVFDPWGKAELNCGNQFATYCSDNGLVHMLCGCGINNTFHTKGSDEHVSDIPVQLMWITWRI